MNGTVLAVYGPPGSGKTRLAHQLADEGFDVREATDCYDECGRHAFRVAGPIDAIDRCLRGIGVRCRRQSGGIVVDLKA